MAKFFNVLLIGFAVFSLAFVWLYYFVKVAWISALCSGGIALCSCIILYKLLPFKTKKYYSKQRKDYLEKLELYLSLYGGKEIVADVFRAKNYEIYFIENGFIAQKPERKLLVWVWFKFKPLARQDFSEILAVNRKINSDKIIIYGKTDFDVKPLCEYSNTRCTVFSVDDLCKILEQNNTLPDLPEISVKKDRKIFIYAFNEKRFPYYIISSIALVGISFISFFPIYSLVMSALMLAAAIYSKYNKKYNEKMQSSF
ncbi:MAG TPA: hypothetical protein PK675_04975 [Clostridia bacterium]|nr:hypothetical protein [Clostridia bacterium]